MRSCRSAALALILRLSLAGKRGMTGWRPGDRRPDRASMLRVDQAGEYGATRIYAGQLAVLRRQLRRGEADLAHGGAGRAPSRPLQQVDGRPPRSPDCARALWNVAGFALGAATALMSEKAALACTDAVETEIDRHYGSQLDALGDEDPELARDIAEFRAEELEHRDTAREAGAMNAAGYPLLTAAIRAGCKMAIGTVETNLRNQKQEWPL